MVVHRIHPYCLQEISVSCSGEEYLAENIFIPFLVALQRHEGLL